VPQKRPVLEASIGRDDSRHRSLLTAEDIRENDRGIVVTIEVTIVM